MGAAGIGRLGRTELRHPPLCGPHRWGQEGGPSSGSPVPFQSCCVSAHVAATSPQPTRAPGGSDRFHMRKRVRQGCILSPCLFNLYAEYISKMLGWKKHKLESRFLGEISLTSDIQMTPPLWQKVKRNWRTSWWRWKRRVKVLAESSTFRKLRSWHLALPL